MNHTPEISQESRDELRDAVISKLFLLPAFRLKGRQIDVLKTYALNQLNNNISQIQFNKNHHSISPDSSYQTSQSTNHFAEPNEFRGSLKIIKITSRMTKIITWRKLLWTFLFPALAYILINKISNIWFNLTGIAFMLAFPFVFFAFGVDILFLHALVKNLFNYLYRVSKEIQLYINCVYLIKNQEEIFTESINGLSNKIIKEFVNEEIRRTDYNEKKINIAVLTIAFGISFIVIFITGDLLTTIIKGIASFINIIELFPAIQNLDIQTFWLIFLFPLSLAWARDLAIEVSKGYRKELHQSLFLIDLYEED